MEELSIQEHEGYPDKPVLEDKSNPIVKSLISVGLFIGAWYLFFDQNIQFILMLVMVLFIHEMGHFLAMKKFNYVDVKMFFIPLLGALVTGEKSKISQRQRAIILLAGPVPGILIGTIMYFIGLSSGNADMIMLANIFVFLNMFNLLPISPLDGGQLVETLFFNSKGTIKTIFLIISAVGMAFLAIALESYVLLIIPFFMFARLSGQFKLNTIKKNMVKAGLNLEQEFDELSNEEYWLIRKHIISNMLAFKKVPNDKLEVCRQEKLIVNQMKAILINKPELDLTALEKTYVIGTWVFFIVAPIIAIAVFSIFLLP